MHQPLASFDALQLLEAPAAAPVLLAEVKAQLRIEHPDDDLMIDRLIKTAASYTDAKGALGHAMITQKWGQWVNSVPPQYVRLAMGPLIEVTAVKYYDIDGALQTDTLSNYEITGTDFTTRIGPKSWVQLARDARSGRRDPHRIHSRLRGDICQRAGDAAPCNDAADRPLV